MNQRNNHGGRNHQRSAPRREPQRGNLTSDAPSNVSRRSPRNNQTNQRQNWFHRTPQRDYKSRRHSLFPKERIEVFSLRQKIDSSNEINISVEYLSRATLKQLDLEKWFKKVQNLITANKWNVIQTRLTLEVICEKELLPVETEYPTPFDLLNNIRKACFPERRFE